MLSNGWATVLYLWNENPPPPMTPNTMQAEEAAECILALTA